jgi:hypothetical protein
MMHSGPPSVRKRTVGHFNRSKDNGLGTPSATNSNRGWCDKYVVKVIDGNELLAQSELQPPVDLAALDEISDLLHPIETVPGVNDGLPVIVLCDLRGKDQAKFPRRYLYEAATEWAAAQGRPAERSLFLGCKLCVMKKGLDVPEIEGSSGTRSIRRLVKHTNTDRAVFSCQPCPPLGFNHSGKVMNFSSLVVIGEARAVI